MIRKPKYSKKNQGFDLEHEHSHISRWSSKEADLEKADLANLEEADLADLAELEMNVIYHFLPFSLGIWT